MQSLQIWFIIILSLITEQNKYRKGMQFQLLTFFAKSSIVDVGKVLNVILESP